MKTTRFLLAAAIAMAAPACSGTIVAPEAEVDTPAALQTSTSEGTSTEEEPAPAESDDRTGLLGSTGG